MILKILKHPDPFLKKACEAVGAGMFGNEKLLEIKRDMLETMSAANGVGLAANQVGIGLRIVCVALSGGDEGMPGPVAFMCNPVLKQSDPELSELKEGCLSVPGVYERVGRSRRVLVGWQDEFGEAKEAWLEDLAAVCAAHEMDHLEGMLFFERLSRLKSDTLLRKYKKRMG